MAPLPKIAKVAHGENLAPKSSKSSKKIPLLLFSGGTLRTTSIMNSLLKSEILYLSPRFFYFLYSSNFHFFFFCLSLCLVPIICLETPLFFVVTIYCKLYKLFRLGVAFFSFFLFSIEDIDYEDTQS